MSAMLSVPVAHAAEPAASADVSAPITITAKKYKEDEAPESRYRLPESGRAASQTFTRQDIEAMHPKDLYEVIEQGLGMMTTRKGRKDFNNIQGRAGDTIGVIVDGIYIPWSQSSRVLANIPTEWVESVKIIRDSTILTLGPLTSFTSNLGAPNQGFVVITTRKANGLANEAKISASSYGTTDFNFLHGNMQGDYYYNIGYANAKTSGKDGWNNAGDSNAFLLKAGYDGPKLNYNATLYMDQGMKQFQRGMIGDTLSDAKWKYDPLSALMFSFSLAKPWSDRHVTQLSYGYSRVADDLVQASYASKAMTVYNQQDYLRELNFFHTIKSADNTFKIGGQAMWWHSPTGEFYYETIERQEELYGFYVYDEKRINDRLTLDGGMRIDSKHITKGVNRYYATGNSGTDRIENQWAQPANSYAVGAAYKLDPVHRLSARLSYSSQPTDSYITTLNNKALDPETRMKYEAALTANYSSGFNASLTAFLYDIHNYKLSVGTKKVGSDTVNIYDDADLVRRGIELGFNGRLGKVWNYFLGYSYVESSNASDNATFPHSIYTFRLSHKVKGWESNLIARSVGGYAQNSQSLGGFTTIDLNVSKKISKNTALTIFGRNITNQQYATQYIVSEKGSGKAEGYYYDPGSIFGVELSTKF